MVHVLRGLAEEARALHGARAHQCGGQHGDEAGLGGLGDRRVDQGQLQQCADTGQVVEARSGHLGAALHVDGAERLTDLQVVLGLEALRPEVTDRAVRLQDDEVLLAADRHVLVDDVAEQQEKTLGLGVGLVLCGVGRLDLGLQLIGLLEELGALLGSGLGDQLPERLLLGAEFVEADAGRPAQLVGGEQGVDERDVLSTGALGGANTVGVLTEQAKVNHPSRLPVRGSTARTDIAERGALPELPESIILRESRVGREVEVVNKRARLPRKGIKVPGRLTHRRCPRGELGCRGGPVVHRTPLIELVIHRL